MCFLVRISALCALLVGVATLPAPIPTGSETKRFFSHQGLPPNKLSVLRQVLEPIQHEKPKMTSNRASPAKTTRLTATSFSKFLFSHRKPRGLELTEVRTLPLASSNSLRTGTIKPPELLHRNRAIGDVCTNQASCAVGEICTSGEGASCPFDAQCFCTSLGATSTCSSEEDCKVPGEVCVEIEDFRGCLAESIANLLDLKIVCVDARALAHLPRDRLVFKRHAIARVLCDENDSCATGSHMVVFKGRAMRMRTYCEMTSCTEAVMEVNNPRYDHGLRIKSKTNGLQYTVFAARYDTTVEESMIRMAVHLGF